jgi:tetratricopeptide (TPR) repeat protein
MWSRFPICVWIWAATGSLAFQPDTAMLRKLFEEALSRRQHEYGGADARTAQAARDLGLFLCRSGDTPSARRAMAEAVHIDEKALGPNAQQTLEDVATLASVSPRAEAEPLLARAAESPDPTVAGPALTSLAAMRKSAGDRPAAASFLRRALPKAAAVDGADGSTVAMILSELALVVPPSEAIPLFERALAIDQQKLGREDLQTMSIVRKLATLLRAAGRLADAVALERQFGISAAHN